MPGKKYTPEDWASVTPKNKPRSTTRRRINALSVAKLTVRLMEGPATFNELIEVTGLSRHTVRHYVLALHQEQAVHVAAWEQDAAGRQRIPAYALGNNKDVPIPKKTNSELCKAFRRRAEQIQMLGAIAGQGPAFVSRQKQAETTPA